jgi:Zn-finger nucleic acid-binding protein
VTCRVARSFQNHAQVDSVYCGKCGSSNLEVFWTSKTLGPHLCPICAKSKIEGGEAESMMRTSRKSLVGASADPSPERASVRQRNVILGPKELLSRHESAPVLSQYS